MFGEVLQKLTHYNIPIVALKGLVLRDFYPDKWMRYMSDFDLLVRESDMSQIDSILKNSGILVGMMILRNHNMNTEFYQNLIFILNWFRH